MKNYKKTLIGSIIAFFIGTSCCWLSSLALGLGGIAIVGTIASFIECAQPLLILTGICLAIVAILLYFRRN